MIISDFNVSFSGANVRKSSRVAIGIFFGLVFGAGCFSATSPVRAAATFTPLGLFGGDLSRATDVSANGSVVVGIVADVATDRFEVFHWTSAQVMFRPALVQDLAAVSADGSVVVGTSRSGEAFRWTPGGAFEGLGDLPGGVFNSFGLGVSADGQVVVGASTTATGDEAFRWTRATGMVALGDLPGGDRRSVARGVSLDGSVVVGFGNVEGSRAEAVRWTSATGMVGLGFLPGSGGSDARAVSADGSVVVGSNSFFGPRPMDNTLQAFRWTQAEGMVGLGDLPSGRLNSQAFDVSADGSVIVGIGETSFDGALGRSEAFYWSAETGMFNLRDLLVSLGATGLDDWFALTEARGVSADGLTIVGSGFRTGAIAPEAFVATVPEPSTIVLAALAALVLWMICLRRRRMVKYYSTLK